MSLLSKNSRSSSRTARTTILHIATDIEADSPGREIVALASLTQRAGWRGIIASSGGKLVNEAERSAVRHVRVPINKPSLINRWQSNVRLRSLLQHERPSILHAHGLPAAQRALKLARESRLPLVVDITQPLEASPSNKRWFGLLRAAKHPIRVPSEFMAEYLRSVFECADEQINIVAPGIDLQICSARFISAERLQSLSQRWRLPEQASVILAPMPFHAGYGHKTLLQALAKIQNENVFAVLVGRHDSDNGYQTEIENLIETLGLSGKVIMPDYCHDLPAACWLSSLIVAANSQPRGQNMELLAAQAIGRPVVATDAGANRDMVLSGETAWIVPADNANALAEALGQAVKLDTNQRLNMADTAHNFIADAFPLDVWFDGIMGIYEQRLQPTARSRQAA